MPVKIKNLVILGSTGSIGLQTLDIVRKFPDRFRVVGLAGGRNTLLLKEQVNEFKPDFAYSLDKTNLPYSTKFVSMEVMAKYDKADIIVIATSGTTGLLPSITAIKAKKKIAIANKEVLVMAGNIITSLADKNNIRVIPIDSEHSAIWQCLQGESNFISRIILTASGGPFYRYSKAQLANVTIEETLKHPTWKMGKKVTVDSASLMNKGLETIEAHWLFSVPYSKIQIVIHPKSIVHSMVEFIDGSVKAQMSYPDMHYPILYALSHPDRYANHNLPFLDLLKIGNLTFEEIDNNSFPCLPLALKAGEQGGTYPAALCASDEVAVEAFLEGAIKFTSISDIVSEILDNHNQVANPDLEDILAADCWARETAKQLVFKRCK